MILAIILYLIGALCMGCVGFFLICLGGKAPRFPELLLIGLLVVAWPVALPWFIWKVIRPFLKMIFRR